MMRNFGAATERETAGAAMLAKLGRIDGGIRMVKP
jgi:hypothetical protein